MAPRGGAQPFAHDFNSADSAVAIPTAQTGQVAVPVAGTWGIRSNQAYSATDANNDSVTWILDDHGAPTIYEPILNGDLTSNTVNRRFAFSFHGNDASNTLLINVTGAGALTLSKVDGGVSTNLSSTTITKPANGANYRVTVVLNGTAFDLYLNGAWIARFTLASADAIKFLAFHKIGLALLKAGAPTTAANAVSLTVNNGSNP